MVGNSDSDFKSAGMQTSTDLDMSCPEKHYQNRLAEIVA